MTFRSDRQIIEDLARSLYDGAVNAGDVCEALGGFYCNVHAEPDYDPLWWDQTVKLAEKHAAMPALACPTGTGNSHWAVTLRAADVIPEMKDSTEVVVLPLGAFLELAQRRHEKSLDSVSANG